jgi:hypothetical protein
VSTLRETLRELADARGKAIVPVTTLRETLRELADARGKAIVPVRTLRETLHEFAEPRGKAIVPVKELRAARPEFAAARGESIGAGDRLAERVLGLRERVSQRRACLETNRDGNGGLAAGNDRLAERVPFFGERLPSFSETLQGIRAGSDRLVEECGPFAERLDAGRATVREPPGRVDVEAEARMRGLGHRKVRTYRRAALSAPTRNSVSVATTSDADERSPVNVVGTSPASAPVVR